MANSSDSGCGAIIVVAVVAFLIGRTSVGDPSPSPELVTPPAAQQFVDIPATEIDNELSVAPSRAFDEPEADSFTYFANCSAARAAGAAPVRSGDPGYAPRLDRDGDGVGCE